MKVIFGTTNKRKIEDLETIIKKLNFNIEVLGLEDIGWNLGEIDEYGKTIEENSLIKANAIFNFCKDNNILYPIITDDSGLFCDGLNGEPGVYTARYADDEKSIDYSLPDYQCVIKLLRNLNCKNRKAIYRCAVTCMMSDGSYFQEFGESSGIIAEEIIGDLRKPYFYSVFILDEYQKVFSALKGDELYNTYRCIALNKVLRKVNKDVESI